MPGVVAVMISRLRHMFIVAFQGVDRHYINAVNDGDCYFPDHKLPVQYRAIIFAVSLAS